MGTKMWYIGVLFLILQNIIHAIDIEIKELEIKENLRFIKEPENTFVLSLVQEVSLDCLASSTVGKKPITYQWTKRENDGRVTVVSQDSSRYFQNGTLVFKANSLLNGHSGIYQCKAWNDEGLILSREATLTYAVIHSYSNTGSTRRLVTAENDSLAIKCPIEDFSLGDVQYKWTKDGDEVMSSTSIFISMDGSLYFSMVNKTDAGDYICEVSFRQIPGNGLYVGDPSKNTKKSGVTKIEIIDKVLGGDNRTFSVVESFPRVFPQQPKIGQTIELECMAFGILPLTFTWMFNGALLGPNSKPKLSDYNRRLTISNVQVTDEGTYTCVVVDQDDNEQLHFTSLKVAGLPIFSLQLTDRIAKSNSFLKMSCFVYSPAAPIVRWLKNGQYVQNITDEIYADSQSLILFSPSTNDEGMYQCAATNAYGTVYSTAKVVVMEIPSDTSGSSLLKSTCIYLFIIQVIVFIFNSLR